MTLIFIISYNIDTYIHHFRQHCHLYSSFHTTLTLIFIISGNIATYIHHFRQHWHLYSSFQTTLTLIFIISDNIETYIHHFRHIDIYIHHFRQHWHLYSFFQTITTLATTCLWESHPRSTASLLTMTSPTVERWWKCSIRCLVYMSSADISWRPVMLLCWAKTCLSSCQLVNTVQL